MQAKSSCKTTQLGHAHATTVQDLIERGITTIN